jgi:starch-binding outer membrane protein, SusD/RagB family
MKNKYIYTVCLAGLITLGSCKKLTDDLNVNPNQPTDAPADLILNGTEVGSILVYEGNLARIAGIFSNSFTGTDRQYVEYENYNSSAPDYDDTWDNLYSGVIAQAKIGEAKATAVNNKLQMGIFQVIQAQAFGTAADLWGDVPFSEVGQPEKFPNPAFEPQAQVYAGVQTLLDNAIANLSSGVGQSPKTKDIFYQGSAANWIAAANTLKARFFLHTKNYAAAITAAGNGIKDPANNMMGRHGDIYFSNFNVYYSFLTYDRPAYMTADGAVAPAYLDSSNPKYRGNAKTDETARFNYLYQTGLNTSGLDPNVLVAFDWGNDVSEDGFFGATTSFPLVTFEENNLTLAEALAKTSNLPGALSALNAHRNYMSSGGYINSGYVSMGLKYDPYLLTDFAPAGMENPLLSGQSTQQALLKEILEERYVTFIGQLEQFTDLRRTKNLIGVTPKKGTKIPQRFLYAQSEINTNTSTPKLVAGDLFKETPINTSAY